MTVLTSTPDLLSQLSQGPIKMGDLKKMAKEIKKDHALAMELWDSREFYPRMLAVLIMDKKLIGQDLIDRLADDLQTHNSDQRVRITDWFLANQLMKDNRLKALINTWEHAPSPILRRLFWYQQGRLRWTGQTPPDNTAELLASLENNLATEEPEVQWAMNFTAGWIGVYDPKHRSQVVTLGEKVGLYKGDPVSRGCTPNYLPEFVEIEVGKRKA
ncbi:MAG: DNA alkylation repair protein [Chloroflexota bacterium]